MVRTSWPLLFFSPAASCSQTPARLQSLNLACQLPEFDAVLARFSCESRSIHSCSPRFGRSTCSHSNRTRKVHCIGLLNLLIRCQAVWSEVAKLGSCSEIMTKLKFENRHRRFWKILAYLVSSRLQFKVYSAFGSKLKEDHQHLCSHRWEI